MATKTFKGRIQNKHDTEVNWSAATNFRPLAGELIIYDEDDTHSTPRLKIGNGNTLVNNLPFIPTVSTLGQTGQLKDGVQDTTHRLVTDTEKSAWNSKQTQLTNDQLNAVNSGITATKVSTYDGYAATINNKLNKATGKSLVYVNSGTGVPTTIGFAENTAPASSMVRRNTDGAVVATNLATPFNNITNLSDNLGKRLIYVGGDKTINSGLSKITINSNIYDIDFNGATITVNFDERPLVANTYDGLLKGHSHCVIRNLNLKVIIKPFSTDTTLTGYNVLDTFGGIENSLITINSNEASGQGTVNITVRGIANADHIANTKVDLKCYTERATAICYSYCNYLFWCRADGAGIYSMYDNPLGKFYNFAECNYLTNCQDLSSYGYSAILDYEQQRPYMFLNCSYLTNCSFISSSNDVFSVSTVGKSPLDSIQDTNDGKTKAYVKPAGGSGITPAIDIDTEPNSGTIVRRLTDGQIRAADAKANTDLTTLKQVNTIVSSYTQGNPSQDGTATLTKIKIADVVYTIPQQSTVDAYTKAETNALLDTKANVSDIPTVSTLGQTGQLKDGVQDTTHRLVTDTEKSAWNSKQTQLTNDQLNAVNSGITATKVSTYDGYATAINNKVDKVEGKGLSTNDFTNDEKNKLAGIETGAQKNTITGVKGSAETSYRIGNVNITKTNIGLGNVDNVKQYSATNPNFGSTSPLMDGTASVGSATTYARSDHKHPTDTSRASTAVATTSTNGLMSSLDKTKLDGIETGAQVNEIETITAGSNVTVSKSGKTVTISATGGGGTAVVANPTLTGSEANLTALQVGATKYGIKTLKVTIW